MKVKDLMSGEPGYCLPGDTLVRAAGIMSERDCGFIPVVDEEMAVLGVITDRDICIALASRNKKASEIKAGDILTGETICVRPDDKIESVLKAMKKNQVRRFPVRDGDKRLIGVISLRDVILASRKEKRLRKKIYGVMKELARPRSIVLFEVS